MTYADKYVGALAHGQLTNTRLALSKAEGKENRCQASPNASPTAASADTRAEATAPATPALTSASPAAPSATAPDSASPPPTPTPNAGTLTALTSNPASADSDPPTEPWSGGRLRPPTEQSDDPDHDPQPDDLPHDLAQASLAEILLWRIGVPADRQRVLESHRHAATTFDLAPPLTAPKIAAAIGQVSIAMLDRQLQPAEANVMLFALQTMLSAVRVQITADTIHQRQRAALSAMRLNREEVEGWERVD